MSNNDRIKEVIEHIDTVFNIKDELEFEQKALILLSLSKFQDVWSKTYCGYSGAVERVLDMDCNVNKTFLKTIKQDLKIILRS